MVSFGVLFDIFGIFWYLIVFLPGPYKLPNGVVSYSSEQGWRGDRGGPEGGGAGGRRHRQEDRPPGGSLLQN